MIERMRAVFSTPSVAVRTFAAGVVALALPGAAWLVYVTGGAKFSILHIMYVPIIFAALVFGARGGTIGGLAAGLLLGPYMPIDTATGEAQQLHYWLFRTVIFCLIGGLVGLGASALRQQLRMLTWLSDHDARTGLLDRRGLLHTLRERIARRQAGPFLVVVQLNNFLEIQNTFGPDFGDRVLTHVIERGRRVMPVDVPIALIQPDRLAAVFAGGAATKEMRAEIEAHIRESYEVDGVPVHVDFGMGAAEYPVHGVTAEELLQKASIAMHVAVTRKQPFCLYDGAADRTSRDNLVLLGLIPAALLNNEFTVWHQAKVDLASGRVTGAEALLRWSHPQRGLIPPGSFIPQIEETALINNVTQWVIQATLADGAAWASRGQVLGIAINLSVRNLRHRVLLEVLHEATLRYGIDPNRVELEITESAVMHDFAYCAQLVTQLRELGYRVAIDDFGTGHSSLAYLQKLPACTLKIDQAFIRNLVNDANDQKIVHAILNLAKSLNLETVAEGVEDEGALRMLRSWGCDYAQGFILHRPAPSADFLAWVDDRPNEPGGYATSPLPRLR